MSVVISVENLSKSYRLGQIGTGTFAHDLNVWWARKRGKPNPMLRIGETDHNYRGNEQIWALRDINFTVKQGEVLGIIGRNGAGKSTLLKILSRVTAPTSGRVRVKGRIASLLEVGTGFHPEMTGRENVFLNGAIMGMSRKEIGRKFDEIVDFAGVEKFIDTPVKRYSSGMYVRLAFAVAAHLEPEILVVDEVLAVGDAEFQKKCLGKMGEVASEGRTVLFVSHNMAAINKLCDVSLLFVEGKVTAQGETQLITQEYLNINNSRDESAGSYGDNYDLLKNQNNKTVTIERIELLQENGKPLPLSGVRKGMIIRLHYKAYQSIHNVGFIVSINSRNGVELCRFSTMPISGYNIEKIDGPGLVELIFKELPLTGGTYFLTIGITLPNIETLVLLKDATWFLVFAKDAYDSGFSMDTTRGFLLLAHEWQHSRK